MLQPFFTACAAQVPLPRVHVLAPDIDFIRQRGYADLKREFTPGTKNGRQWPTWDTKDRKVVYRGGPNGPVRPTFVTAVNALQSDDYDVKLVSGPEEGTLFVDHPETKGDRLKFEQMAAWISNHQLESNFGEEEAGGAGDDVYTI